MDRLSPATLAPNTDRSYREAWKHFTGWWHLVGRIPLPATVETTALYVTAMLVAGLKTTTVEIRLSGIAHQHEAAGLSPTGALRTHGFLPLPRASP